VEQAQEMLHCVEAECRNVRLRLNAKKTEVMAYNVAHSEIKTYLTEDLKYLGSHIGSLGKDIQIRKALAWRALYSMKKVWKSSMHAELKKKLFVTTVEAILLYGCETWTLSARVEYRLDGCYTRMLRMVITLRGWIK